MAIVSGAAAPPPQAVESRRKAFETFLEEQWEYTLSHSPEFASILGDKRWNDKVSDVSQKAIEADLVRRRNSWPASSRSIRRDSASRKSCETLLVRSFREELEDAHFTRWKMPVSRSRGCTDAPQLVSLLSFKTVKDYEDYVAACGRCPGSSTIRSRRCASGWPRA
jgi:uncharacterized protein (DUF885 family)